MVLSKTLTDNRAIFTIIAVLALIAVIDTTLSNYIGNTGVNLSLNLTIPLFVVFLIIALACQFLLFVIANNKIGDLRKKIPYVNLLFYLVVAYQCVYTVLMVNIVFQIATFSYYLTTLLAIATLISHTIPFIIFGILSLQFLKWYKRTKGILLLSFGIAFATLAISEELAATGISMSLLTKSDVITSVSEPLFPTLEEQPFLLMMADTYWVFAYLSFVATWVSIAMLMRQRSKTIGSKRYWLIVSIPLAFFVTVIIGVPGITPIYDWFDPVFLTIFFALNSTAGAILFAIAFWVLSKTVKNKPIVRGYLIISAYGLLLFFVSDQAVVVHAPYPPFGTATISVLGISSFYVFIGLYSSAISISRDSELRRQIRKSVSQEESKFLDNIGTAYMHERIEKNVTIAERSRDNLVQETGIESSLTQDQIRQYVEEAISEVQKVKLKER